MSAPSNDSILEFATQIAEQAGDLIVQMRAYNQINHNYKQGVELVTSADLASDKMITDAIKLRYPDHQILAEESNPDYEKIQHAEQPVWIIDPIDGTVNYAHHHQQVAISIAFSVKGKVQVAVVYNPFSAEMFTAIVNQGAWLNDQPIQCSPVKDLSKALIATGFPYDKTGKLPLLMRQLHKILEQCADVRRLGSAALDICWVALGRLDGYYETVSCWDFAAAQLIAREAGARFGHFIELPEGALAEMHGENILISTPHLYDELKTILANA